MMQSRSHEDWCLYLLEPSQWSSLVRWFTLVAVINHDTCILHLSRFTRPWSLRSLVPLSPKEKCINTSDRVQSVREPKNDTLQVILNLMRCYFWRFVRTSDKKHLYNINHQPAFGVYTAISIKVAGWEFWA